MTLATPATLMERTETATDSRVRVFVLGRFEVWVGQTLVIGPSWSRRKARTLLKMVSVQRPPVVHRELLQDWLWPELDSSAAANNLHKNLHYLRSALAAHAAANAVALKAQQVVLAADVWIDVGAFYVAAQQANSAGSGDRVQQFEAALALYSGDLLPEDVYEEWAASPREAACAVRRQLLRDLASVYEAEGALEQAVDRLQQLVAAEPLDEQAHRTLMRLHARMGRRHQALRQYQLCREALDRELGIDPSVETEALQLAILQGDEQRAVSDGTSKSSRAVIRRDVAMPPLIGRERELETIEELLEAAGGGATRVLFIHGEAGVGKTHLAEHVLSIAEATYASQTLVGRSFELDAPVSYRPVRQMLARVASDAPRQLEDALRSALHLRRLLPSGATDARTVADPAVLQIELFDEVVQLLAHLASVGRPLVLLFDDVHAADEASLVFIHHLCRKLSEVGTPALVLATYRQEEAAADGNRPLAQLMASLRRDRIMRDMTLHPLGEPYMRIVIERTFGSEPVDRQLVDAIVGQADGNPFFAGELVRTLVDEGRASLVEGRWHEHPTRCEGLRVPVAIDDLLQRRLVRLGAAARNVLNVAALDGHDVEFGLLRHTVPMSEREILDGLDECLHASVLEETPSGYRYRHSLLRHAVYARLSRARRQQLHRSVAEALVEDAVAEPERIGTHFEQSDEPQRAVEHLGLAAGAAAAVFDNQHAINLYERAVALSNRCRDTSSGDARVASLLDELGDLVRRTGDASRGATIFESALPHLVTSGDAPRAFNVAFKAALSYIVAGDAAAAARLIAHTLEPMANAYPENVPVGRMYYLLAQLRWHSGQHLEALAAAEAAVRAAQASQDLTERAQAYEVMGLACHSLGEWQKGVEYELNRDALEVPGFLDEALERHL